MTKHSHNPPAAYQTMTIVANRPICREHYRLTLLAASFGPAAPGQFVHIGVDRRDDADGRRATTTAGIPLLRRAFSIADLRREGSACEIDVIYRVVGAGTRWMAALSQGDTVSVIGPLGNVLVAPQQPSACWLIAGGVGLPPMLWFARQLAQGNHRPVFLLGARSRDFVPLSILERDTGLVADELANVPLIVATDDGSLGFAGNVVDAMREHLRRVEAGDRPSAVYTCGPEVMMHGVAKVCAERSIPCQVCMERDMACGIGTCQSCVVPVCDADTPDGWRYALCCAEGPVFDAADVCWDAGTGPP